MKDVNIYFSDKKLKDAYINWKKEDPKFYRFLKRATDEIKKNPNVGEHVSNKQIPKSFYKKFPDAIDSAIFVYKLPKAWRMIYALRGSEIEILAIILEICNHNKYDDIFGYHTS